MSWIGALIGYFILGWPGALLGFFIGVLVRRALVLGVGGINPLSIGKRQQQFIKTTFMLMGSLAKSDGRISQSEVDHVEAFMTRLNMSAERRREAIAFFKQGAEPDFDSEPLIQEFIAVCGQTRSMRQMLLGYLVGVVVADGHIDPREQAMLRTFAIQLGFQGAWFDQFIHMVQSQYRFAGGSASASGGADALKDAYAALGVSESDDDATIRRAYKRQISENHPDKLIGQGMPQDMVNEATERSQRIQTAYDLIRKVRGKG